MGMTCARRGLERVGRGMRGRRRAPPSGWGLRGREADDALRRALQPATPRKTPRTSAGVPSRPTGTSYAKSAGQSARHRGTGRLRQRACTGVHQEILPLAWATVSIGDPRSKRGKRARCAGCRRRERRTYPPPRSLPELPFIAGCRSFRKRGSRVDATIDTPAIRTRLLTRGDIVTCRRRTRAARAPVPYS